MQLLQGADGKRAYRCVGHFSVLCARVFKEALPLWRQPRALGRRVHLRGERWSHHGSEHQLNVPALTDAAADSAQARSASPSNWMVTMQRPSCLATCAVSTNPSPSFAAQHVYLPESSRQLSASGSSPFSAEAAPSTSAGVRGVFALKLSELPRTVRPANQYTCAPPSSSSWAP